MHETTGFSIPIELEAQFNRLRSLEEGRELWIKREVVTVDFSENKAAYVERLTFDLNAEHFTNNTAIGGFHYIPIGWRDRESFLEFNCRTDRGNSVQLLTLDYRHLFMKWMFWSLCCEKGFIEPDLVPSCLLKRLDAQIKFGKVDETEVKCCEEQHNELWSQIQSNKRLRDLYQILGRRESLILKVPAGDVLTMIKLEEVKTLKKPFQSYADRLIGRMEGVLVMRNATSIKFVAPSDMKFISVKGIPIYESAFKQKTEMLIKARLYGDGERAHSRIQAKSSIIAWTLILHPRRHQLIVPGMRISVLGIFSCLYWMLSGFGTPSNVVDIRNSFSLSVVIAYYWYYIHLFDKNYARSFIYNSVTERQRFLLSLCMLSVMLFPFVGHISIVLVSNLHRLGIAMFSADAISPAIRWGITILLELMLVDFWCSWEMGSLKYKTA